MDRHKLLEHIRESLASISAPRFFETERGFQGALLTQLENRIPNYVLPEGALIEQEHQKSPAQHGLRIRPDIIIHEPFKPERHSTRTEGNIAVIELKLNASKVRAQNDFNSLAEMINVLQYPLGIFINIASHKTHSELVPLSVKDLIVCFAVSLDNGHVKVVENGTQPISQQR